MRIPWKKTGLILILSLLLYRNRKLALSLKMMFLPTITFKFLAIILGLILLQVILQYLKSLLV